MSPCNGWHTSRERGATRASRSCRPGTSQRARFRLSGLQPGVYEVRVRAAGLESNWDRFLVSTGDETPDLRREYARYKTLYRSPNLEALEKHLRELAALDRLNAGPWIRLADVAVGKRPLDETLRRYANASAALSRRRQHFESLGQVDIATRIATHERLLARVQKVLPRVYAPNSNLALLIQEGVVKRYAVIDRKSGNVVEEIHATLSATE
jgi:hypothetical protein